MQDITIRKMDFAFPDVLDPIVIAGKPDMRALARGYSEMAVRSS